MAHPDPTHGRDDPDVLILRQLIEPVPPSRESDPFAQDVRRIRHLLRRCKGSSWPGFGSLISGSQVERELHR